MPNRALVRFAWVTLACTVAVILWGAVVRATGSGAGCGESWPLCNGKLVFGTPPLAKIIELAHRSSTAIDGILIAVLALWSFRAYKKGHPARLGAALSAFFLITEALLGAALVKFGLVVSDTSPARGVVLSIHLANTLALLASLTLTAWWAGGHPRVRWDGRAWMSLAAVVALGITGALAALADTLFPAPSLEAGMAGDWAAGASWLVRLRALHPLLAVAAGGWLFYYAASRMRAARAEANVVLTLVILQLAAGAINLFLLAPLAMQAIHLLLADLLWIGLVTLCESPETERGGAR